jgi:hypothetical protein
VNPSNTLVDSQLDTGLFDPGTGLWAGETALSKVARINPP